MSTYHAFAPIYDDWSAHMTEDVPFYVELAKESDGPLVELAVGSGRVAIPVARETGRPVLGIDALYGGFGREQFDESANEFVWVVRKPV